MNAQSVQSWHVAVLALLILAAFLTLWPLGLGGDYMNHLARTYIQGFLASDPTLQQYYDVSFDFIPDLTMDLIVPWLSHVIGIYPAGAVTVWLAFVLPPIAGLALAKVLHGRITWISLLGFLTVFNANMDWGFVNYTVSSGLALLAFALWIRMSASWRRSVVFAGLSLFLVVNHALAFLAFGFLALTWELICFAHNERGTRFAFLRQLLVLDFPAVALALLFLAFSLQGAADLPATLDPLYSVSLKSQSLFTGTLYGNFPLAFVLTTALVAFFWLGIRQNWLAFAPKTAWLCAAFLGLVVFMPTAIFGIWGLHLRFTGLLIILLAASVVPTAELSKRWRQRMAGIAAVLAIATFANGAIHMRSVNQQYDQLKQVFVALPEGATVLHVLADPSTDSPFTAHASALSVIERSAYVPNLFTNTSPVDVTPQMIDWHMPQAKPVFVEDLQALAAQPPIASKNGYWSLGFARAWPDRWDHLLYFRDAGDGDLSGFPVCEISATPEIILYKTGTCT